MERSIRTYEPKNSKGYNVKLRAQTEFHIQWGLQVQW